MSWHRIVIPFTLLFVIYSSMLHAKSLMQVSEDELIMRGLLYDEYKAYENSYEVYKKLFDDTGEEAYLFREVTAALMSRTHITESIVRLRSWDEKHPGKVEVKRLLIPLYLTIREVENAKKEADFLLEQSNELVDLDLASNSYLYAGNFKRALELLTRIYQTQPQEAILLRMAEIMDQFTNERLRAIQLLETHRRMNISSHTIYLKLLELYQKQRDVDGILDTYKALYAQDDNELYLKKIIDVFVYKRDMDGAIAFLEETEAKDELLYELYKTKRYFVKALALLDKLYKQDKNAKWIAEKGVLLFEKSEDKDDKEMIANVIAQFEKAIELGNDDSIYLNYYGYTLIDKEVNVTKGIAIIEDALTQQPNNTYYLDSLAWGYYKMRDCGKAYKLMKRVVDEEGLEQSEIIEHWDAIKQCK